MSRQQQHALKTSQPIDCRILYGHLASNRYTYYYQFFITHSLFHSRLKTFFLQILPTAAFLFLLQDWLHDFTDFYGYL